MSTVRLKRPYEGHAKGSEISVPFGKGKELVTMGIAEYPQQAPVALVQTGPSLADIEATKKRTLAVEARNSDLERENAELKKDLDKAIGEKNAAEKRATTAETELAKKRP